MSIAKVLQPVNTMNTHAVEQDGLISYCGEEDCMARELWVRLSKRMLEKIWI